MASEVTFDRVPPHSTEAEMAVLGAMMGDREAAGIAVEVLVPDSFYLERHRTIFQALSDLYDSGLLGDPVVAQEELRKRGSLESAGGSTYLAEIIDKTPIYANAEHYCRIVRDRSLARSLVETLTRIYRKVGEYDGANVMEMLDEAEQEIYKISSRQISTDPLDIRTILKEAFEQLEDADRGGRFGLPTGFTDLDDLTGGLRRSDLIVVAGRPSMGKTSLALNIALHVAAEKRKGVLLFSAEMSSTDIGLNMLCMHGRVDASKLRTGRLSPEDWAGLSGESLGDLSEAPIYIDDAPAISVTELRAKSRRLASRHDIRLIIVDYLQLVRCPSETESRQQEIAAISRSLKALARELRLPVIAVSQLNRAPEGRTDRRPMLADLRESGAIEQDADLVLLLFRPGYYNPDDEELKGLTSVIVAKHRNGPTGKRFLIFQEQFMRFENLASVELSMKQREAL